MSYYYWLGAKFYCLIRIIAHDQNSPDILFFIHMFYIKYNL